MNPLAAAAIDWTRATARRSMRLPARRGPCSLEEGERLFVHANAYAPAGWDYMTDRLQAAHSMTATACRTDILRSVHVPAVFHMARGAGRPQFTPVPSVRDPALASRQLARRRRGCRPATRRNPAACYALLHHEQEHTHLLPRALRCRCRSAEDRQGRVAGAARGAALRGR